MRYWLCSVEKNAKSMAWLLVGIAWLAAAGCSPAPSGNQVVEGNLRYKVLQGNAIVTGVADSNVEEISIPNEIANSPVTRIHDQAFLRCESLTSVTIPDSVTSIGEGAFSECKSLTSVTIPDSVTSIGDVTFLRCESLTSVTIPDSVTSIGEWAFSCCESLTSVTIPDSVTSIGDVAFYGCENLTSVTIPDDVKIGKDAFMGCPWQPAPNSED